MTQNSNMGTTREHTSDLYRYTYAEASALIHVHPFEHMHITYIYITSPTRSSKFYWLEVRSFGMLRVIYRNKN